MNKIYIAGPDIFRPDAMNIAERQKALCARYDFVPLHPLDGDPPMATSPDAAMDIFLANRSRMCAADAIIANLTPFRGPSADPGTVFELGFMLALPRPAFAYSRTAKLFRQRTIAIDAGAILEPGTGRWTDGEGLEIEDFGLADNLMIDCALRVSGSPLITPYGPIDEPADELGCFERCLEQARRTLGTTIS